MNSKSKNNLIRNPSLIKIYLITLMAVLGVSSITPAFPEISEHFNIDYESVGLLITIFTLPGILLAPLIGIIADRFGRKIVLIPSIFIFAIFGFSCGLTDSFETLLLFRFLQGLGAASLGILNVTLIGDLFTGKDRSAAMGFNASILSVGTALYPTIGGLLALFGWYFPFFLPVIAIPIGFFLLTLDNPEPNNNLSLKEYFTTTYSILKSTKVITYFLASTITFIILYGAILTFLPKLMKDYFAASALLIGLTTTLMSVSTAATSSQLGKIINKIGAHNTLTYSYLVYMISLILIPFCDNLFLLVLPIFLFGIGHGTNFPAVQILLTEIAPIENRAAIMSLNGIVLRLGQTLGPIISGFIYILFGLKLTFILTALLAFLMSLILFITRLSDKNSKGQLNA